MAVEFSCREAGHLACGWKTKAATEDELVAKIARHAKDKHGVAEPSETIVEYLKSTVKKT